VLEGGNYTHIIGLVSLFFRLFVVHRWQHNLVVDFIESSHDLGADAIFCEDQGGDSQKWLVVAYVEPDMNQLFVIRVELR
jgi:hypothetical protein